MHPPRTVVATVCAFTLAGMLTTTATSPTPAGAQTRGWVWPVSGPIIRRFDAPTSTYGPGHRGLDLAAPIGTVVRAAASGTVTASGIVNGNRYVSLLVAGDHVITYSYLVSAAVTVGTVVASGQPVGRSGAGHPSSAIPGLHIAVRSSGVYVDPFPFFQPLDVRPFIRLA